MHHPRLCAAVLACAFMLVTSVAEAGRNSTSASCLNSQTQSLLSRLQAVVGPVRLVSTCRQGATIKGTGGSPSLHRYGCAFDFVTSRKAEAVRWLRSNAPGSTITYRNSPHVHADIGRRNCRGG